MGLLKGFFKGRTEKKMVVIGLDGVPFTFVEKLISKGELPVLKSLISQGDFKRMNSVIPTISSVAWSSFMTGQDPAGHNIFGFIDRKADPFKLFIPTARWRKGTTIWEELEQRNKRSVIINLPLTYPPDELKGIMVSGFLATDINKATYPAEIAKELKDLDYIIDVDSWVARESKSRFLENLDKALEVRFNTLFNFLINKKWDYFHCHIMETDRINHFFWADMEEGNPEYERAFINFYKKIDEFIGKLLDYLDDTTELMILSDHGFCKIEKEVQLNYWLKNNGYLHFDVDNPESIEDMSPGTSAYSLLPGRIYINRKGREEKGWVTAGKYFDLREELKEKLLKIKDKDRGKPVIKNVYFREEIYNGPYLEQAADLIVVPYDGYDLKSSVNSDNLFNRGFIQGMHTYDDAFIYLKGAKGRLDSVRSIKDVKDIILNIFAGD